MATYYFGSLPEIVEQRPPRPARDDENGLTAARQWSTLATSDVAAILRMRDAIGLRRGVPFQDVNGAIPDPYCLCQSVEALGKPPAIHGGRGQYIVTAEFARKQITPGAQPGGPVRWSRKASLVSKPVDIDVYGNAILSSSLEPPDPPITAFLRDEVLHGEFYFRAATELEAIKVFRPFEGLINDKPIPLFGIGVGCLLVHPFEARATDTGWVFMSVDLQVRPSITDPITLFPLDPETGKPYEGWDDVFPDRGRRAVVIDPVTNKATTSTDLSKRFGWIKDGNGQYTPDPLPLDGAGNLAGSGTLQAPTAGGAGNVLAYLAFLTQVTQTTTLLVAKNYLHVNFDLIPFPK